MKQRLVFVIVGAVLVLAACGSTDESDAIAPNDMFEPELSTPTVSPSSAKTEPTDRTEAPPSPSPTSDAMPYPVYGLGETFELEGMRLTVNSFEVTKEVPSTQGAPHVAADGEDFVYIKTHFENIGNEGVDLSCSGLIDVYVEGFDTEGRSMEPYFETSYIPGNPECNHSLLSGQGHDWNFAYRMVEGAEPMALVFTEINRWEDIVIFNFTDGDLELELE